MLTIPDTFKQKFKLVASELFKFWHIANLSFIAKLNIVYNTHNNLLCEIIYNYTDYKNILNKDA